MSFLLIHKLKSATHDVHISYRKNNKTMIHMVQMMFTSFTEKITKQYAPLIIERDVYGYKYNLSTLLICSQ